MPEKGSKLIAGHNLVSAKGGVVPTRGKAIVDTQLAIVVQKGTYRWIASCSGLAVKHMIEVGIEVINADYRGPVKAILFKNLNMKKRII